MAEKKDTIEFRWLHVEKGPYLPKGCAWTVAGYSADVLQYRLGAKYKWKNVPQAVKTEPAPEYS